MEGTQPRTKTRATVSGVHPAELRGDIHEDMLSRQDETRLEGRKETAPPDARSVTLQHSRASFGGGGERRGGTTREGVSG